VQTVTMKNTGTLSLAIGGISISGADSLQFAQTNNCGSSLAAGASCTVNVTYNPTALNSPMTASLDVNVASLPTQSVALSGLVGVMSYTLSPSPLAFSSPLNTQSAAQTVTMNNTGTLPLSISGITIGGANNLQFAQTNNCGTSIAAGASCTVNVTFDPLFRNPAGMNALLNVNVASPGTSQSVALSGTVL
jgi:hypothetical protein